MVSRWRRTLRTLFVTMPLVLGVILMWRWWPYPREAVYSLYRDQGKAQTLAELQGYHKQSSEHFDIFYTDDDENVVDMILETAEASWTPVAAQVGYTPEGRVPLIVYASRTALREAFGWGNGESAMGVYWKGTIRLLSPNVWIDEESPKQQLKVFQKLNPIAHELTHYVLDYLTNGNYPRWFSEGLAQRVEHNISGYMWIEPDSSLRYGLYSLSELERDFDGLINQPLAYRESYLLVDFMAKRLGDDGLETLIQKLGRGVPFRSAVESTYGMTVQEIFARWEQWVANNLELLEPAG